MEGLEKALMFYTTCTLLQEKVERSSQYVRAKNLPATAAAMTYHTLRVFLQIYLRKGITDNLKPTEWGWKNVDGHMVAMQLDLSSASKKLIQVIRCDFKTGCHTARCTYKRHGVDCSSLCGACKGQSCSNATKLIPMDDVPDDD